MSIKTLLYEFGAPVLRRIFRGRVVFKKLKDNRMVLHYDKSQHLNFLLCTEIDYEPQVRRILLDKIRPDDLVFEIGSNIGQYALSLANHLNYNGKLICVEPDAENFYFLSLNIDKNNLRNVTLINKAISDKPGITIFFRDTITGGRMGSLVKEFVGNHYEGQRQEVETITMEELIAEFGQPDFVKVDVEGAETMVFANADFISKDTIYFIEVREKTKRYIGQLFERMGFTITLLDKNPQRLNSIDEIPGFANLLFEHPSRTIK